MTCNNTFFYHLHYLIVYRRYRFSHDDPNTNTSLKGDRDVFTRIKPYMDGVYFAHVLWRFQCVSQWFTDVFGWFGVIIGCFRRVLGVYFDHIIGCLGRKPPWPGIKQRPRFALTYNHSIFKRILRIFCDHMAVIHSKSTSYPQWLTIIHSLSTTCVSLWITIIHHDPSRLT